jgi:peroxiredoxin Q/BCP
MSIKDGSLAPDFTLPDQAGKLHRLSDERGKWVLIYFYPKDDTPGCTREACAFRDHYAQAKKQGLTIFGVSVDPVEKHAKFAAKYKLPFTLLSDTTKEVVNKYGVWMKKKFMGREYMGTLRWSFLVNPMGRVARTYALVKPDTHAEQILSDLKMFKANT